MIVRVLNDNKPAYMKTTGVERHYRTPFLSTLIYGTPIYFPSIYCIIGHMKKITLILGLMLVLTFGIIHSTNYASASTSSSSSKTCTNNATLGSDGHCHCDDGYKKVTQEDADGRAHSCIESAEDGPSCDDLQATYDSMNAEYTIAKNRLSYAQTALTSATNAYQTAAANPANVKTLGTVSYSSCVKPDDAVGCGGDVGSFTSTSKTSGGSSCTTLSQQCDQLDALLTSTNQAGCLLMAQANIFTQAIVTSATTTASTTTSTATTTATTTNSTATTTATTTTTTTSDPAFVIGLTPNTIKQGDSFTVSATINSSAVSRYSISASKDGVNLGNLLTGATPSTTARPTSISQTFNTSSSILTGTYLIQISNDANFTQYSSAYLTINSNLGSSSSFSTQTQTTTSATASTVTTNTTQNVSGLGQVIFLLPSANSIQRKSIVSQIHWGYNAYVFGNIELYVQTVCATGAVGCYPLTSLIASNLPVSSVYYNWVIPSSIPSNSYAILVAKQGATVLGYSSNFIVQN